MQRRYRDFSDAKILVEKSASVPNTSVVELESLACAVAICDTELASEL
jgi:hypothetical protein